MASRTIALMKKKKKKKNDLFCNYEVTIRAMDPTAPETLQFLKRKSQVDLSGLRSTQRSKGSPSLHVLLPEMFRLGGWCDSDTEAPLHLRGGPEGEKTLWRERLSPCEAEVAVGPRKPASHSLQVRSSKTRKSEGWRHVLVLKALDVDAPSFLPVTVTVFPRKTGGVPVVRSGSSVKPAPATVHLRQAKPTWIT